MRAPGAMCWGGVDTVDMGSGGVEMLRLLPHRKHTRTHRHTHTVSTPFYSLLTACCVKSVRPIPVHPPSTPPLTPHSPSTHPSYSQRLPSHPPRLQARALRCRRMPDRPRRRPRRRVQRTRPHARGARRAGRAPGHRSPVPAGPRAGQRGLRRGIRGRVHVGCARGRPGCDGGVCGHARGLGPPHVRGGPPSYGHHEARRRGAGGVDARSGAGLWPVF